MIVAIIDNIRSLYNIGSIFRTADGLGVKKIFICEKSGTPKGKQLDKIHKTSLGAEKSTAWEYSKSTVKTITRLKQQGFEIIAIEKTLNSQSILDYKMTNKKIALIFGHELYGVNEAVLALSNRIIHLPMMGSKQSYNVSVAFALAVSTLKWRKYSS